MILRRGFRSFLQGPVFRLLKPPNLDATSLPSTAAQHHPGPVVLGPSVQSHCLTLAVLQPEFNTLICHSSLFVGVPSMVVFVLHNTSCSCFLGWAHWQILSYVCSDLIIFAILWALQQPTQLMQRGFKSRQSAVASQLYYYVSVLLYTHTRYVQLALLSKGEVPVDCMNSSDVESFSPGGRKKKLFAEHQISMPSTHMKVRYFVL